MLPHAVFFLGWFPSQQPKSTPEPSPGFSPLPILEPKALLGQKHPSLAEQVAPLLIPILIVVNHLSSACCVLGHGAKHFMYVISLNPQGCPEVSLVTAILHLSKLRHGRIMWLERSTGKFQTKARPLAIGLFLKLLCVRGVLHS